MRRVGSLPFSASGECVRGDRLELMPQPDGIIWYVDDEGSTDQLTLGFFIHENSLHCGAVNDGVLNKENA